MAGICLRSPELIRQELNLIQIGLFPRFMGLEPLPDFILQTRNIYFQPQILFEPLVFSFISCLLHPLQNQA